MSSAAMLAEIETDKATVEVESAFSGVVHKHLAAEEDVLPVGVPIAVIGEAGEQIDLVHRAHDRSIYARGALDAGAWLIPLVWSGDSSSGLPTRRRSCASLPPMSR